MERKYFEGLNTLRFIAAFLVLVMHVRGFFFRNIDPSFGNFPILQKGHTAVSFFFTLSGFLITYQMLEEAAVAGRVAIRRFYLKRIRRIWPLYYLIICLGVTTYFIALPLFGVATKNHFDIPIVLFFYVFFMPNVPSSFWNVGSILGITWSIGVEEQFYLFWAPLFNFFRKNLLAFFIAVFVLFGLLQIYNHHFVRGASLRALLYTFQFHNMAIGAIAAYFYFNHPKVFETGWFFSKPFQLVMCIVVLAYLFVIELDQFNAYYGIVVSLLYVYIIVSCAIPGKSVFKITWQPLDYAGKVSYGVYMYHSICIYAVSILIDEMKQHFYSQPFLLTVFLLLTFLLTLALSSASYEFLKSDFSFAKSRFFKALAE